MIDGFDQRVLDRLLRDVGERVTGILDTTREKVQNEVRQGLAEGLSPAQLGDRIEQAAAFDEYRAELIARTETATLLNQAAIASYQEFGIEMVTVIDGDDDEICASVNGQEWTLAQAQENPLGHPNCTRDFAPIIGQRAPEPAAPGAPETPPMDTPLGQTDKGYIPAGSLEGDARTEVVGYVPAGQADNLGSLFHNFEADPDAFSVENGLGVPRGAEERLTMLGQLDTGRPYNGSFELAARSGDMTAAVEEARFTWEQGSSTPAGALLQSAAAAELDAGGAIWSRGQALLEVSDEARAVVRAQYEATQLAHPEGGSITLYRGLQSETGSRNVLESWTASPSIAQQYNGGGVLKADVPIDAIYADFSDGHNVEVVVFGDRIPVSNISQWR